MECLMILLKKLQIYLKTLNTKCLKDLLKVFRGKSLEKFPIETDDSEAIPGCVPEEKDFWSYFSSHSRRYSRRYLSWKYSRKNP